MDIVKILKELIFGKSVSGRSKRVIISAIKEGKEAMSSGNKKLMKNAVVEMDTALGKALSDIYGNDSVGSNLKKAKKRFSSRKVYELAWDVHKLRNKLVHEPENNFSKQDLTKAIKNFIKVLSSIK